MDLSLPWETGRKKATRNLQVKHILEGAVGESLGLENVC